MAPTNPLERLRKSLGLSQAQVAKAVGVSQPNYQRWESGSSPIPAKKIADLADVLHTTEDVLLGKVRYSRVSLGYIEDDPDPSYWGELVIHFRSKSKPLITSISFAEMKRLKVALHGDQAEFSGGLAMLEVRGLCNEHYVVRRSAISEAYLSDEGADEYAARGESYKDFLPIPIIDPRLWDVFSGVNLELEGIEDSSTLEDIYEALSYFMTQKEIADYLLLDEGSTLPTPELTATEFVTRVGMDAMGIASPLTDDDEISAKDRERRKKVLLDRASFTLVHLCTHHDRRILITESELMQDVFTFLVNALVGQEGESACFPMPEQVQTAYFPISAIDYVRFPAHFLDRALNDQDINIYGLSGGPDQD